jgi:hypothetical protein
MANPYARNTPSGQREYDNESYNTPAPRNTLFYENTAEKTELPPNPPPHSISPEPYNPYPRTEEVRPYGDSSQNNIPASRGNLYAPQDANPSQSSFYPLNPSQSYQDGYQNSTGAYSGPYQETMLNAPTPPLPKKRTLLSTLFNGDQRFAWFCWVISIVQVGVFVGELIRNASVMKTPIQIQPTFNPLIGPSSYVLPRSQCQESC